MMTKDLIQQLPADEQPIATKLNSLVEDVQPSQSFQWDLETELMEKAKTPSRPGQLWFTKFVPVLGWVALATGALFLLNWTLRSMTANLSPATEENSPPVSFETLVRQGNLCAGPLAAGHGFEVSITNPQKTEFVPLDQENSIDEMRSFYWSSDGTRLAVLGNTTGQGKIHIIDLAGGPVVHLLSSSDLGYLMEAAWSPDGKKFAAWSGPNNRILAIINADDTPPADVNLGIQMLGTLHFTPGGERILVYGADDSTAGLFEVTLDGSESQLISALVEDASGYAWSQDGSRLAYFEMDREQGEARLLSEDAATGEKTFLAALPIPKGSGSSIPGAANLSWSPDGQWITFEFGRGAADRAIYLAYADGSGLVKVVEEAHAPAISADGRCLAYIRDNQVFLLDLSEISHTSNPGTSLLLADLPAGKGPADFRLDKLQWRP